MKKIRVALIGYGRSGRDIHHSAIATLSDKYEIVVYVDQDAERRELIKKENPGAEVLNDYRELFGRTDIDLVVNASFSFEHARISEDLLLQGFNVLSEKPAAKDREELLQAMQAAKISGKQYFIFQQYRFQPTYNKIIEVINSGKLGRIVKIGFHYNGFSRRWDWQTVHGFMAGSLRNTGPHPMDMSLELMDFPEDVEVFCAMDRMHTFGNGEDFVKMILRAPGKPIADIEISACSFPKPTYEIQGTYGVLEGTDKEIHWKYYVEEEAPEQHLITKSIRRDDCTPIYCHEELPVHEESYTPEDYGFNPKNCGYYEALYDTLTTGAEFRVKLEQILLQLKVTEEAHKQNYALFND